MPQWTTPTSGRLLLLLFFILTLFTSVQAVSRDDHPEVNVSGGTERVLGYLEFIVRVCPLASNGVVVKLWQNS